MSNNSLTILQVRIMRRDDDAEDPVSVEVLGNGRVSAYYASGDSTLHASLGALGEDLETIGELFVDRSDPNDPVLRTRRTK